MIAALALLTVPLGAYFYAPSTNRYQLTLRRPDRYELGMRGCFSGWDEEGWFDTKDGRLRLHRESGDDLSEGDPEAVHDFVVVRWGKATFLVPPRDVRSFGAEVRAGSGGADRPFDAFRPESGAKLSEGRPEVPAAYRPWFEKGETARVLAVACDRATVDLGAADGLLPGTVLVSRQKKGVAYFVVRRSTAHSAEGVWGRYDGDDVAPPAVGDGFESMAHAAGTRMIAAAMQPETTIRASHGSVAPGEGR